MGLVCAALFAATVLGGCGSSSSSSAPDPGAVVVARVGGQDIHQSQLDLRLQSAEVALRQAGAATPSGSTDPMLITLRASVLKSLIVDTVIAQEATFRHINISDPDVEAEVQHDASTAGGSNALQTQLAEAGGSLDQLRDEIRSRHNEQNLEDLFAQERAGQVASDLAGGQPFATVATQFSDDQTSQPKGGDLGLVTTATLDSGDPAFKTAVVGLAPGQTTPSPVRDRAGYDILRVDASDATGYSLHRILVAAPNPYTVRERPAWFGEAILSALQQLCAQNKVAVLIPGAAQPCASASAAPSPSR